ncbi:MAG: glycosyltransferase [Actinomycetota bacterium]
MTAPDVSILIVSWNTRSSTERCLASIASSVDDGTRYEIILVDNGSRDGSAEAGEGREDVRLIRNSGNRGYAAGVNQAYAGARGKMILLLNSDVQLTPGSLSALVRFLRRHPDAAGVAPLYRYPDGSFQPHYYRLPTFASSLALATGFRFLPPFARRFRSYRMLDEDFSCPRPVEQPSASCLLLRRSCLPPGSVLDERYPIFFNDVDLARRIAGAGGTMWMTPEAAVVHELGASTRLLGDTLRARHHLGSLVRYLQTTLPRALLVVFRIVVLADRILRRLLRREGEPPLRDVWRALRGDPAPLPDWDVRPWIVYFAAIPWASEAHRQHELARQLARDYRLLFVEPAGLGSSRRMSVEQVGPGLWRARPATLLPLGRLLPAVNLVNRRVAARRLRRWLDERPGRRLLWIDEDLAAPVVGRLGESARVYDATDLDWTFTRRWNRPHLRRALRRAVGSANLVLVSSPALPRHLPTNGTRPVELLNACDPERFRPKGPQAEALASIPRPRLGYAGAVDERAFDAALVAAVAARRPDWSIVLVGPSSPAARRRLDGLVNVHLLGPFPYREMPDLVRGFDVGLIPYRLDGLADYVLPKKFFEYLAAGKPVVTTPLPAFRSLDAPRHEAATAEEFVAAVEVALAEATHTGHARDRRKAALANTWDARGAQLRTLLEAIGGR